MKENELANKNKIEYEQRVKQSPARHRIHRQQRQTHKIKHWDVSLSGFANPFFFFFWCFDVCVSHKHAAEEEQIEGQCSTESPHAGTPYLI